MRRWRPNKQWYGLLYFIIWEINENVWCYIVITNIEEGWARQNYSVTCRPWKCHYLYCHCTYPSGGGASRVHGSKTCRASVSSQLRSQMRQSLLSFLPKGGYGILLVDQYCKLNPLQDVGPLVFKDIQYAGLPSPSQNISVHWVYILYVL